MFGLFLEIFFVFIFVVSSVDFFEIGIKLLELIKIVLKIVRIYKKKYYN